MTSLNGSDSPALKRGTSARNSASKLTPYKLVPLHNLYSETIRLASQFFIVQSSMLMTSLTDKY
jgi:hypothetical protein